MCTLTHYVSLSLSLSLSHTLFLTHTYNVIELLKEN